MYKETGACRVTSLVRAGASIPEALADCGSGIDWDDWLHGLQKCLDG